MNNISVSYHRNVLFLLSFVVIQICVIKTALASELRQYDNEISQLEQSLTEQNQRMKAQERLLEEYRAALDRQRGDLDALKRQVQEKAAQESAVSAPHASGIPRVQPVSLPGDRGAAAPVQPNGAGRPGATPAASKSAVAQSTSVQEDKPRERPDVPLIVEKGGVLLRQGEIVIEPALDFSLVETNRVEVAGFTVLPAILIGNFDISQVERETLTAALTGRIGVTDRLELEARIPYVRRDDRETRRPIGTGAADEETVDIDGDGLGDIEFAAHYQFNDGVGRWPFFVGNMRVKSDTGTSPFDVDTDASGNPTELPTGTGFWSLQPSITAIVPTDPAVVFANINYTWNMSRDVDGFGDIDPGDMFGGSLGLGFALNERLSISMAYDHIYVLETTQNGSDNNSAFHVGRMLFGGSYRFADRAAVNLNFAVGVTEQAPDIQTELRVPISFRPFN